jgi:hypothetical protein
MAALFSTAGCEERFAGLPEIIPAELDVSGPSGIATLRPIADGDTLHLTQPVQGGFVLYVGALGRNLSTRSASLLGELRRSQAGDGTPLEEPGGVMYSDERSVKIELSTLGMQAVLPDPNEVANVPACPNPLDVDVVDNPLYLVLTYKDAAGRSARAVRSVIPRCMQTSAELRNSCVCQCLAGYTTTRCFRAADGGAGDGGPFDAASGG